MAQADIEGDARKFESFLEVRPELKTELYNQADLLNPVAG